MTPPTPPSTPGRTWRRRGFLTLAAAGALAACSPPRPLALVYRDASVCTGCAESVARLLAGHPTTPMRVQFCGPHDRPLTARTLAGARVYAQPGGGDLGPAWQRMRRYAATITGWVRGGGNYLGFCLGGYLAGATPGFGLLPGDTDQYIATDDATVDSTDDTVVTVDWLGSRRHAFFQDGPVFLLRPGANATVLARYPNGGIAALVAPYGTGRVGVVGPHPEATADWYRGAGIANPDGVRLDLGYDLVTRTLAR